MQTLMIHGRLAAAHACALTPRRVVRFCHTKLLAHATARRACACACACACQFQERDNAVVESSVPKKILICLDNFNVGILRVSWQTLPRQGLRKIPQNSLNFYP